MRLITLVFTSLFLLVGCSNKQPCEPTVVYNTKDVYIPVPCDVEHPSCNLNGASAKETLDNMVKCIADYYQALDVCRRK